MANFIFQKQAMVEGESRYSDSVTVPSGLTRVRVELDMNTQERRDPSTHVSAIIEIFSEADRIWVHLASTTLEGRPENTVQTAPFIELGPTTLNQIVGRQVRCRIHARSDGNYGATLTWT